MKTLHQALMGTLLVAVLALAVGFVAPGSSITAVAVAQHGHAPQHEAAGDGLADRFHEMIEALELTEAQRETLAEPMAGAFEAMQTLHRLHGEIAAELTEEQREVFDEMAHHLMGGGDGDEGRHDGGHGH